MRFVVQRVSQARVQVENRAVGEIGPGLLILMAVEEGDGAELAGRGAEKIANLRIFPDDRMKMNRSLLDTGGEALVVSQFTLAGSVRKGRRPSFERAARPEVARELCDRFADRLRALGVQVETGSFGAMMDVDLINHGPVTIWLESGRDGEFGP